MHTSGTRPRVEPIAVIGMQGRFPKARNIREFWNNLVEGIECISFFSEQELREAGEDPAFLGTPGYVNAGGVLDDVDLFDAQFFGYSARDAEIRDPQHRLFLECSWEALEGAGYNPETYEGMIGVYGGCGLSTYLYHLYANPDRLTYVDSYSLAIANDKDYVTTTVSYKLNLRGPSVAVQTACSTSLVAICMACQSLLAGQCDMALAGGVSIGLPQRRIYEYQPGGILSPDGHCRSFDASAAGTVGGNGVGVVVLKRLSEAITDGDHIRAVIKGAALNNDGSLKVGFTAPSVDGQAEVIRMAQEMAGVHPDTIDYIEAHGTATALGDPIEVAALTQAFRVHTGRNGYCRIGSVKSNVGHLDAAAGVAGLIKTVLCLENNLIPPSLHFKQANQEIDFGSTPFRVNSVLSEWLPNGTPRRAGVSSFGIGGTNAHVVVEEAPAPITPGAARSHQILLLSARTPTALEAATDHLVSHLKTTPGLNLADVAFTLQVGRKAFPHRRALITKELEPASAVTPLELRDARQVFTASQETDRPIVFLFPGQGTQYLDMGLGLYTSEAAFREQVDLCAEILKPLLDLDLRRLLFPSASERDEAEALIGQTAFTQPALFTIEYALAMLWIEWGVKPDAMIGHSIGEYVAACLAGVFSLEDALAIVAMRGLLMGEMHPGSMLAVPLAEASLRDLANDSISIAAVNSPSLSVLSGPFEDIERISAHLAVNGIQGRKLHTSHAFHSQMMDPMLKAFVEQVSTVELQSPSIPYLSNLTGTWIESEQAIDPEYYARQLRHTVRYSDCVAEVLKDPDCILLEVGPGQTLGTLARQQVRSASNRHILFSLPTANTKTDDVEFLLTNLANLWLAGANLDWKGFHSRERRLRIPLPTYPFQRQRYWIGPPESSVAVGVEDAESRRTDDWFYAPSWRPVKSVALAPQTAARQWLVFADRIGLAEHVVERLRTRGAEVTVVDQSDRYRRIDADTHEVSPDAKEDYQALLQALSDQGREPDHVLHLWTVSEEPSGADPLEAFDLQQRVGFDSLVLLGQVMASHNFAEPLQIGVVSSHLQAVTGNEELSPAKATVLGACKVIPQEHPHLRFRSIDIAVADLRKDAANLAERLIAELSIEPFHSVVAYRNGHRWIEQFDQVRLHPPIPEETTMLREGGVYVITGGLGQIGLALADHLAETVKAKLVLIARSQLPDRARWETYLESNGEGATGEKIRRLLRMEEAGAEVLVLQADASEKTQMKRAIDLAYERFSVIHGVIHGAGNTSETGVYPVSQTHLELCREHFLPKAHGALILDELLRGKNLDFVFLHSSLSALLGGIGFIAYASANSFLDAWAKRQQTVQEVRWISANWDSWEFPRDGEQTDDWKPESDAITPWEGASAFRNVLDSGLAQLAVSTGDLNAQIAEWVNLESLAASETGFGPEANISRYPRPNLSSEYVSARDSPEERMLSIWEELLAVAPVGVNDNFFEMGGHSLLALQLLSRVHRDLQVLLPVQRIFEAPTVAELVQSIEKDRQGALVEDEKLGEMIEMIEGLSDTEVQQILRGETPSILPV